MQKNKDACEICCKKFNGMFVSEHQCKRCARIICKECCTKKKPIFTKANIKLQQHRCCDACFPISVANLNYIKQNNLIFLSDSQIGKQWVELSNIDVLGQEEKQVLHISQTITMIKISDLWPQFTDTMRQLIGSSLGKMPIIQAQQFIQTIISKHNLKLSQQHSLILLYIMCHAGESSAVKIIKYLMSIISCVKQQNILQIIFMNLTEAKNQKMMKNIVSNTKNQLTQTFFIDLFPTTIINEIILEVLLAGTPTYIQCIVAWVINQYSNLFLSSASISQVKTYIYKNVDKNHFSKGIKSIRKKILQKDKKKKSIQSQSQKKQMKDLQSPQKSSLKNAGKSEQNGYDKQQDNVMKKINDAAQFLRKLEQGELNEEQLNLEDMDNLNEYLDQVIAQNDQAIQECQHFDELLSGIQEQMYKSNGKSLSL